MELRWVLIGITVVVIAAVLFDGFRRSRAGKPAPNVQSPRAARTKDEDADFNPELPSGRARVIRREPRMSSDPVPDMTTPAMPVVGGAARAGAPAAPQAPQAAPIVRRIEQVDMFGDVEIPAAQPAPAREIQESGALPRRDAAPAAAAGKAPPRAERAEKPKRAAPEDVIVVHVMGGQQRLDGKKLLQATLDAGLRFGDYSIFHRYESGAHDAAAMFSMANAVEPGVFDLDTMEGQAFVGVSFFLMLPGPANSRQALDTMIEAARRVAKDTGGELHDQQHSVLTAQTAEHLRQRVMEFERRRLAQQRVNG